MLEPKMVFALPTLFDLSRVINPYFGSAGGNSKNCALENLRDISQPHSFKRKTMRMPYKKIA